MTMRNTYEISNMHLFDLSRACSCTGRHFPVERLGISVVWPRRPANIPSIPFKSYLERVREGVNAAAVAFDIAEQRDKTFRDADAANLASAQEYVDGLNAQRVCGAGEINDQYLAEEIREGQV